MKYQNTLADNKIQCTICPRNCTLKEGQSGFCYVRKNINNNIVLESYGYNTGLAIDPVEKKPLYHFYPSSSVLSFGTLGCNMGCQFCQNWTTTKTKTDIKGFNKSTPEEIVKTALKYNCKSIAFTYNDPVIFLEYAIDTAKIAQKNEIKTIAVTSGFINPEPRKEFFKYIDAVNIDLKGFSERFYKKNCLAKLAPVLDTIDYVSNETNCWLELTTMLIENENDFEEELKQECDWILNKLGTCIPLYFSAFFPNYKFSNRTPTKVETLLKAYQIATTMGLNYVYTGNIHAIETSTTYCKTCKNRLIIRDGYRVLENNLINSSCPRCGRKCDGYFDK